MMVIVQLIGGLGNQLFQYAAGRRLAHKYNVPLKLDLTRFQTYKLHAYSLHHCNIDASAATTGDLRHFPPVPPRNTIRQKVHALFAPRGLPRLVEPHFHFVPAVMDAQPPVYLQGYWQSEQYFQDIAPIIRTECKVITPTDQANQQMCDTIQNCTAVSVHVRRTDYVSHTQTNQIHGACDIPYYQRAVDHIQNSVSSPRFFVFSDDPEWTRANLTFDWDAVFVTHNKADKNYEDLRLMTLCQHHIIANSSFSWWGAWLGQNPNKIVIVPQRWFQTPDRDDRDLVPLTWLRL